jgi:hypothetical protein
MSLTDPKFYENKRVWLIIGGLAFVLIGAALYITDCGSNYFFNRGVTADKQAIANKTTQIAEETKTIDQMKANRDEHIGELKVLANNLVNANISDNRAKEEVQQAVANLAAVVNSNSNVNARVEDVNKKLDQLGIQ